MKFSGRAIGLPVGLALLVGPGIAVSQTLDASIIDDDLRGQIDFRDVSFQDCFEQPQCSAQGVTITAERRGNDGVTWVPAQIYWDPVDGVAVMAGGQNDEIDFDERLLIVFDGTKEGTINIERVWLSDIFIGEDERYGSIDPAGDEDVEVAVIQSMFANSMVAEAIVDGANVLPPDPFNAEVIAGNQEDGDLFRRVVIRDDVISVVVPDGGATGTGELLSFQITEVDEAKLSLFEGIETVEIELADILLGFNDVPFYIGGTVNADIIEASLGNEADLLGINERAQRTRLVGSVSNGELGVEMDGTLDVDMLIFMSVLGGSNDYSVAGIVQAEDGGR
ncbi:hypothetical protein N8I71_04495 [Roseibacterium sp. SDUM158016]|jgi:hypothetical protein|uniref:hypothetical protein n=1 Tax=Roseicyclus sediminis TaxID=2980997 RepID=UPI0021CE087C|nr:hypothetical protein [Roseibacterium sp. SDUM158016]MCU4652075.1 hypothetical protein [Roseibacterium sp. SDUM158016]